MAALSYIASGVALVAGTALASTIGDISVNWTEVRSSPNATGSITFTAPNVSAAFQAPDPPSVPDWAMSIAVRTNGTADAVAATSISLDGPPSLQAPNGTTLADPSWFACLYILGPSSNGGFSNGSFTHESCGGVLSTKCVDDWISVAGEGVGGSSDPLRCPSVSAPDSCKSAFTSDSAAYYSEGRYANFNGSDVFDWATSDVTYDDAVGGVWPIMIRWQGNGSLSTGVNATLQCIQAYDVQAGSKVPNTAASSSGMVRWAAGIALAVALYVL